MNTGTAKMMNKMINKMMNKLMNRQADLRLPQDAWPATLLAGAIILQIVVLRAPAGLAPASAGAGIVLACTVGRYNLRKLAVALRGLIMLLLAILVARLLAAPTREALLDWSVYASRLIAAITVALTLLDRIGASGIHRGVARLLSPLPAPLRQPLLDIIAAAVYLIPAASRHLKGSSAAARVRYARGRRFLPSTNTIGVVRAGLFSLASLPPRRAEAMVVRGLAGGPLRERKR